MGIQKNHHEVNVNDNHEVIAPERVLGLGDVEMANETLNSLELKVVFWNANTWKSQNCEKLLDTIISADADVICISDARLDAYKDR